MFYNLRMLCLTALFGIIIYGCTGNSSQPIMPDDSVSQPGLSGNADAAINTSENSHYVLLYNLIYIDAENHDNPVIDVIPVREGEIHLNILKFLEAGPCFDCFKIVGFNFPAPGTLNVDIQIEHPFDDLDFSVFDVRGIMMFRGSHAFPAAGKSISDPALGDGALLNADGYTALYNGNTIDAPVGPLQKYYEGNFATPEIPNSDINGFKYYTTDVPSNNRNAFFGDSSGIDVQTFSIKLPTGPFVLGYAVDANWWTPISTPVDDPLTDFDLNANCPEAWKIVIQDFEPGLTSQGGTTKLQIFVADWQGKDTTHPPVVECPELFDGEVQATWKEDGTGFTAYEAVIGNTKLAADGVYLCLVSKEANENNPSVKPWLDISAYQTFLVHVEEKPFNPVEINHVDTPGQAMEVAVSGGYAYVADSGQGLQIIDIDPPESAYIVKSVDTTDARGIAVSGGYAYVADRDSGLQIIDNEPPESAYIVGSVDTPDAAYGVAVSGGYTYVAAYDQSSVSGLLIIIDIEPLGSAYIVSCVNTPDNAMEVAVSGGYAYVADWNPGLQIIDIEPPESAYIVKSVDMPGGALGVAVSGGYAYVVSDGFQELQIIDIDPPESAYIVKSVYTPGTVGGVAVSEGYAYVADSEQGLQMIDIDPPESAYIVGSVDTPGEACGVAVSGSYAYVADRDGGLRIIKLW